MRKIFEFGLFSWICGGKEEQAIELLKDLSPEQIMAVISAINK